MRASTSATTATFFPLRRRIAASSNWTVPSSPPKHWSASAACATRISACAPSPCSIPGRGNLQSALEGMFAACDRACREGANIVILSDRGLDGEHMAIPSLLAVSALEQHLVREKKRTAVSVLLESGEPRDVHQLAMLVGFGARAVNPYLAHECVLGAVRKRAHRQIARAGHRRLRPGAVLRRTQSRLKDGRLHPAGVPEPRSCLKPWASTRRWWTLTSPIRPTVWAARACPASRKTAAIITTAPFWASSAAGRCPASAATACAPARARRNTCTARGHPHAAAGAVERRPRAL